MNNKGMTIIELITTFVLSSIIVIILINVILLMRNMYMNYNLKTRLLIDQANLSNVLNSKLSDGNLESYEICNDNDACYMFNFSNGESLKLIIENDLIKFGNFSYKVDSSSKIGDLKISIKKFDLGTDVKYDSILSINIPISNKLYPNDNFGVNIIYQYNSNKTSL